MQTSPYPVTVISPNSNPPLPLPHNIPQTTACMYNYTYLTYTFIVANPALMPTNHIHSVSNPIQARPYINYVQHALKQKEGALVPIIHHIDNSLRLLDSTLWEWSCALPEMITVQRTETCGHATMEMGTSPMTGSKLSKHICTVSR